MSNKFSSAVKYQDYVFNLHHINKWNLKLFVLYKKRDKYILTMKHLKKNNPIPFDIINLYYHELMSEYSHEGIIFMGGVSL